jgi:GNAT superfamily N-acetyltransferase
MKIPAASSLKAAVTIATPSIDELSTIRYIHAQSLRRAATAWADEAEIAAYDGYIYAPDYAAGIEQAVHAARFFGAYLGGALIATSGWSSIDDDTASARIRWCHVQPLFGRLGIGSSLLHAAETDAANFGHISLVARTTPTATAFFERAGYGITSHGKRDIGSNQTLPVTFLRKNLRPPRTPALF